MKILIDNTGVGIGGIFKIEQEILNYLGQNHDISLVHNYLNRFPSNSKQEVSASILTKRISRIRNILRGILFVWRYSSDSDVVLSLSPSISSVFSRAPLITMIHDFAHNKNFKEIPLSIKLYRKLSYRKVIDKSSALIFVSHTILTNFFATYKMYEKPCFVVQPSGELSERQTKIPIVEESINSGKFLIFVPGHSWNKGVDHVLSCLPYLLKNVTLVILTGMMDDSKEFEKYKTDKMLIHPHIMDKANVIFLPWISEGEYSWLLRNSKLLVMLSEYEGFGMPVRQAHYYGIKQVISEVDSLFEASDFQAVRVNSSKPTQVSAVINSLVLNERSQLNIPLQLNWEEYVSKISSIINEVLNS